ncbi:hypothetical protein LCGC14_1999300 [marine sediment metagenome]|uniref:Uncharacterized protein n=1 Tax=marine sediment metagenome TaxID=412755 RepID=A0A0F9F3I4_9ZZZZ
MSKYSNKATRKLENKILKQSAWEEARDRIHAEMEELARDGLDATLVTIVEMRKYGHMS